LERFDAAERAKERILENILRVVGVSKHLQRQAVHLGFIAVDQLSECPLVSLL
jgi:hypothetical protein